MILLSDRTNRKPTVASHPRLPHVNTTRNEITNEKESKEGKHKHENKKKRSPREKKNRFCILK